MQVQARVEEILRIRLDGAELWDLREFVKEKTEAKDPVWGEQVPSDVTLYRYCRLADRLIAESCRGSRKRLLRRHLAQRRNLFAKAVSQGDVKAALSVLQDEAKLEDLYPPKKLEHRGPDGGPIQVETFTDDERRAALDRVIAHYGLPPGGPGNPGPDRGGTADEVGQVLG